MAGAGYKLFSTGDVLSASDVNTYLMQQTVMSFASAAARTTALSAVLAEGMVSYLQDTNVVEIYTGSSWVSLDDPNAIQNSIVDAKGDLISATADNTPARLAVGNNGETLIADNSTSTGLRYQSNFAAGKNKIINGAFNWWARGTTTNSATTVITFLADRFSSRFDYASGTASLSQQTFTPGTAPVAGYEGSYFLRLTMPSAASSYGSLGQKIEDVRTLAGQTVTASFWAKTSVAQSVGVLLRQDFGTGGSASVDLTTTISLTTSWQRFSFTTTLGSLTGKTIGTSSNLLLQPFSYGIFTSSSTLDIWGVQVEDGSVATAFQTATGTLQGELAACQRYYWRLTAGTTYGTYNAFGVYTAADAWQGIVNHPVLMRVAPTSLEYANLATYDGVTVTAATTIAITTVQTTPLGTYIVNTGLSGRTQFRPAFLFNNNNTAGYLGLSAEL